jgi:hypothetical protein
MPITHPVTTHRVRGEMIFAANVSGPPTKPRVLRKAAGPYGAASRRQLRSYTWSVGCVSPSPPYGRLPKVRPDPASEKRIRPYGEGLAGQEGPRTAGGQKSDPTPNPKKESGRTGRDLRYKKAPVRPAAKSQTGPRIRKKNPAVRGGTCGTRRPPYGRRSPVRPAPAPVRPKM